MASSRELVSTLVETPSAQTPSIGVLRRIAIYPAQVGGPFMKYLHTMVRVTDIGQSLDFYVNKLGLKEIRRIESPAGRFTLIYLAAPGDENAQVELTYNWDPEVYGEGRNFGHLAYEVDNIYETCQHLMDGGVTINRPPRDGRMAFIRSPDNISIELLQKGGALQPQEPWASMPNTGKW
jgi:lactoylglutathione lyase